MPKIIEKRFVARLTDELLFTFILFIFSRIAMMRENNFLFKREASFHTNFSESIFDILWASKNRCWTGCFYGYCENCENYKNWKWKIEKNILSNWKQYQLKQFDSKLESLSKFIVEKDSKLTIYRIFCNDDDNENRSLKFCKRMFINYFSLLYKLKFIGFKSLIWIYRF